MALFNPLYALVIPSLCLVTVPLAILAGITTTLAFSVLLLRVLVVYLEMALSLVPQSFSSLTTRTFPQTITTTASPLPLASPLRRQQQQPNHRRRRSSASGLSGSASSISERGLGLIPSVGAERDFEGVGGWRVGGAEDDELWTTVNPRLEMPERSFGGGRHHHRTPSGPTTPGEGGFLMMKGRTRSPETGGSMKTPTSPNSSRARTPTGPRITFTGMGQADGYFALSRNTSPRATKRY